MVITTKEDPVVSELTATLREWHQIWVSLYLDNQFELFEKIGSILIALIDARTELITLLRSFGTIQDSISREQQINELKTEIVNKLDLGNHLLGLDLVLRDANHRPVDPIELSPVKLYQLHAEASRSQYILIGGSRINSSHGYQESIASTTGSSLYTLSQTGSDNVSTNPHQNQNPYHLQMALKKNHLASLPPDELVEIYFSVVELINNNSQIVPLTDKFLIQIKKDELICGVANTTFANVGPPANREIGMLVQVYRVGRMILAEGHKTAFGKQQNNSNMTQATNSDGSNGSINTTIKQNPNSLTRSRHSTISGYFNMQPNYRRPFGTTFVSLKDNIKNSSIFRETTITTKVMAVTNESEFSQLNEIYPKKNQIKMNQNLPNIQLEMSVKFLSCTQESISKLSTFNPYCLTEKRGFPDIVMPGDFKNDLYFTLESAEFEKGGKSISKNIEASISLIDKSGLVISDCIAPASNCDKLSNYNSCVFYHSNSPRWNESIKINVPLTEFDSAHIRIEFKHCSTKEREKKFLGFSFLPLSDEDGTVIPDKSHELYLYKCDSQMWEGESLNLCKYTSLPYGPSAKMQSNVTKLTSQQNFTHSNREIVTASTFLLSTKLTQNSNLLNLLKWRELIKRNNNEFGDALKKVLVLKGEEIVKFLQDILDTLFDTFTLYTLYPHLYPTSEYDYSALIFKVLVHIFLLLDEPKYQHFRPVLDTYASAHFSATLVYKGLLACLKECLEHSSFVERHGRIQSCLKSLKYVFLFIVQSKLLYSKATGEQNDKLFLKDLKHLFKLFEAILSDTNPKLIPIQETFLQSFPGTLEQLMKVLSPQELVEVVTSLAGSVGWHLPPPLARAKLIFMRETANTSLIKNQDVRIRIADNFCRHLDFYIRNFEELELCHEVLEIMVVKIHDYHWSSIYRLYQLTLKNIPQEDIPLSSAMTVGEINAYSKVGQINANQLDLALINVARELEPLVNLMEPMLQLLDMLVQDFNSDGPLIQKYCTCLLTILKLMGKISFEQFMRRRQLDYLKLCNLFKSLRGVYDPDWSIMQLTSHAILEHPIDEISKDIKLKNESHPMNRQLSSYIILIVDFITHPTLQLEAFSERKKNYVMTVFGDLRLKFTAQLMRFWSDLSKANICDLIPTSIQSFLDAALLPNDELQHKLIPFFWDIIDAEDKFKSNLRQIERCLIDNLDLFMNLDRGNSKFIENFDQILKKMIKENSPAWEQRGLKIINSFTRLMQLLINYRQSLESYDNRSKQMSCLVDLLNFYKDQERMDIYLKYLFKLCDMHLESGHHTEAAFTLKLYADEIRWCNRSLGPLEEFKGLKFPEEHEWCRKEKLYLKMIHYFDLGKCWEESIGLCKELASFYENFLVDYEKVSSILKKLANFLDNILTEHRPEREYFRVEFIGSGLPEFVAGKELIYRGGEYERLATFIQRITSEFPEAQILNSKSRQSLVKNCPGQYLVISNVKPVPFLQDHFKSGQRIINDKIIHYYLNNRLDTFSYDLPIVKGNSAKDKSGEVNLKNLWVGRYMLKIKKQLPDILPWNEVISQEYIEISPINNAIETISSMNLELSKLILGYTKEPNKSISPLTMRLQGVIEAAVNGGPSVIVNAFFKKQSDDLESQQSDHELLIKLRDLLRQQYSILETGLALHSKLAPPEVMPLHDRLVERLPKIRETLLEETSQIENNYEVLNHIPISNRPLVEQSATGIDVAAQKPSSQESLRGRDEVDGHDLNGNIYGEIDDQIYSQPSETHSTNRITPINGTKSELSSPSRHYTSGTSSSLSTLAILSNLPVNRSRVSLTPSKEVTTAYRESANLAANDTCTKAARRLTFDPIKSSIDFGKIAQDSQSSSIPANQEAPPLPPKSFLKDKHQVARAAMNRSPLVPTRQSSSSQHLAPQQPQPQQQHTMTNNRL